MKKKLRLKLIFWLLSSVVFGLAFAGMIRSDWFLTWHLKFSNFFYHQGQGAVMREVVLVAIDDKSFERKNASELRTLQFSKADYARVIENLEKAGAKAIGVDIIFTENTSDADKAALVDTLKRYDNVILAAEPKTPATTGLKPLPEFIEPHPGNLGSILFQPDQDNVVRRQKVLLDDPVVPQSFAVRVARAFLDLIPEDSGRVPSGFRLMDFVARVGDRRVSPITIPLDATDRMNLNFFGPPNSFSSISFVDVLENRFIDRQSGLPLDLGGKMVLIGEMGTGLHDEQYVPTSQGRPMPGVEIHANALQTLLTGQFLVDQSPVGIWGVSMAVLVLALGLFLFLGIVSSVAILVVGCLIYTIVSWIAFEYGLILNTVYPYLAITLMFTVAYLYRYFTEARHARHTERAFSKYVSHHVVRRILENPHELKLGGEKRELTVLFSDIAGFTTISEKVAPEKLVEQLNEYLDAMTGIILDTDGTLDKYIGDAIMAFWGAPLHQPDHAIRACMAALDYQKKLIELRKIWEGRGQLPFHARIGINTGPMIVGNVGSNRRFDYTVIGDAVNLSARLEGVNKVYDTSILINETTYQQAKAHIEVRAIDLLTVKGKTHPVEVYELQARKGELSETQKKLNHHFHEGVVAYRHQEWGKAIEAFEKCLKVVPDDGSSKVYIERCEHLKHETLPKDWDGSYTLKTK
ncbi:CHASE2 domain-containing protein [Candidatus Peregrinibacteria bacterium]|nr:CHASE2 domain-containing protein [Candidatus Peregrinibacteria bacterium]